MTAPGSVLYTWGRLYLRWSGDWDYSNLFFIEGVNDVAFSIGLKREGEYVNICVRKNNSKLAKAAIQIMIFEEDKKIEINDWKEDYMFSNCWPITKFFSSLCFSITCKITWYGFVEGVSEGNLYKKLQQFHRATDFSDVILSVNGAELPAHKIILSTHSPVFFAMLTADMKEKKESRIEIENFEVDVINEMLTYFYTGKTKASEDVDTALKMLELSDMYQINDLKDICVQGLVKNMKVDNVLFILVATDDFNVPKLVDESIKFMVNNRKEVVKLPEFEELLKHKTEIMCKFIRASFET